MFKVISALFQFLRNIFLKVSGFFFEKMRDPVSGKLKWQNPKDLKKISIIVFVVLFIFLIIYQLATSEINLFSGSDDYKEELKNKVGINAEEITATDQLGDPLAKYKGGKTSNNEIPQDSLDPNAPIDFGVCSKLLDLLKTGSSLNFDQRLTLKKCLDQNLTTLNPEELTLAKKLAADALLSEEDKKLLNEMFGSDKSCQDEVNAQVTTTSGNDFMQKAIEDPAINSALVELLQNQEILRQAILNPNELRTRLGLSDSEFSTFQALLDKCSPETILKMISDPKYREVMQKLLKAALEDPEFLNKTGMSPEEKALLSNFLAGNISSDSEDYEIAQALMGGDAAKKSLAQDILKARALGDSELAGALSKKLTGAELTEAEAALARNYSKEGLAKAYANKGNPELSSIFLKQAKGGALSADELARLRGTQDLGIDPKDKEALLKGLTQDIADRQAEIDRLRAEAARAQADARSGANKLANGLELSPEEQAALARFTDLQNKIKDLDEKQRQRQAQISAEAVRLQALLNQTGKTIRTIYPSGVTGQLADWTKCDDARPFTIVRQKRTGNRKAGEQFFNPDGTLLSAEKVQLLKAFRLSKAKDASDKERDRQDLLNPNAALLRNSIGLNSQRAGGDRGNSGGIEQLFLRDQANLVPFKLTPNQSIAGVLLTEILVADKGGSPQKVKVKILQNVHNPKTNEIVIPKNSIAFGTTSGFDADTGIMNLTLDNVMNGGTILQVPLSVASADLSPGLKGEVRDTRGKILLGAFISAFTAGALGAVSQNYIAPFRNSDVLGDSLAGAGLQGGAQVAQQIAEMYAGDLQNAARIFYVPAGVKVVLTPN